MLSCCSGVGEDERREVLLERRERSEGKLSQPEIRLPGALMLLVRVPLLLSKKSDALASPVSFDDRVVMPNSEEEVRFLDLLLLFLRRFALLSPSSPIASALPAVLLRLRCTRSLRTAVSCARSDGEEAERCTT